MAFTNQDIIAAYNQRGDASEADFANYALSNGVTADQLMSARSEMMGTPAASAPAPAPVTSTAPAADRWTDQQYNDFRGWSSGKTMDQITAKAGEIGVTADELGKAFNGSGGQVAGLTGYGTGSMTGNLSTGDKQSDWTYNLQTGWSKKPKAPVNQWNASAPSTGINLSQVQGTTSWDVTPNQTVQSQLEQIIANDSPLMQRARAQAMQTANERGLLNSSMAATAGQAALYDAAMPIAQQDASTYASAGQFNADASNTFSRDNNAFVRDAFMADFNLAANEWAKQQDQQRTYDQLDYTQKLTLDRDAIQNGYQSARDAILNGYTVERDATTNAFTLKRDATQNEFTAGENALDRTAAMQRTAAGQQADTSVQRTAMQIDADNARYAADKKTTAAANLANAKTDWAAKIVNIQTGDLTAEQKSAALVTLTSAYNPIVQSYAVTAGLDPTVASAGLRYDPTPATAAATTPATNVVQNVTQGGDGG